MKSGREVLARQLRQNSHTMVRLSKPKERLIDVDVKKTPQSKE
jgi:hypothetical protein